MKSFQNLQFQLLHWIELNVHVFHQFSPTDHTLFQFIKTTTRLKKPLSSKQIIKLLRVMNIMYQCVMMRQSNVALSWCNSLIDAIDKLTDSMQHFSKSKRQVIQKLDENCLIPRGSIPPFHFDSHVQKQQQQPTVLHDHLQLLNMEYRELLNMEYREWTRVKQELLTTRLQNERTAFINDPFHHQLYNNHLIHAWTIIEDDIIQQKTRDSLLNLLPQQQPLLPPQQPLLPQQQQPLLPPQQVETLLNEFDVYLLKRYKKSIVPIEIMEHVHVCVQALMHWNLYMAHMMIQEDSFVHDVSLFQYLTSVEHYEEQHKNNHITPLTVASQYYKMCEQWDHWNSVQVALIQTLIPLLEECDQQEEKWNMIQMIKQRDKEIQGIIDAWQFKQQQDQLLHLFTMKNDDGSMFMSFDRMIDLVGWLSPQIITPSNHNVTIHNKCEHYVPRHIAQLLIPNGTTTTTTNNNNTIEEKVHFHNNSFHKQLESHMSVNRRRFHLYQWLSSDDFMKQQQYDQVIEETTTLIDTLVTDYHRIKLFTHLVQQVQHNDHFEREEDVIALLQFAIFGSSDHETQQSNTDWFKHYQQLLMEFMNFVQDFDTTTRNNTTKKQCMDSLVVLQSFLKESNRYWKLCKKVAYCQCKKLLFQI